MTTHNILVAVLQLKARTMQNVHCNSSQSRQVTGIDPCTGGAALSLSSQHMVEYIYLCSLLPNGLPQTQRLATASSSGAA